MTKTTTPNTTEIDTPAKRLNDVCNDAPAFDEREALKILLEVFGPEKLRSMMRVMKLLSAD